MASSTRFLSGFISVIVPGRSFEGCSNLLEFVRSLLLSVSVSGPRRSGRIVNISRVSDFTSSNESANSSISSRNTYGRSITTRKSLEFTAARKAWPFLFATTASPKNTPLAVSMRGTYPTGISGSFTFIANMLRVRAGIVTAWGPRKGM